MQLTDFKALTFDCYGTLIDWESGIIEGLRPLTSRAEKTLSQDEILEAHGRHESSQQTVTPTLRYRELLAIVYKRLAEDATLCSLTRIVGHFGVRSPTYAHMDSDALPSLPANVRQWPKFLALYRDPDTSRSVLEIMVSAGPLIALWVIMWAVFPFSPALSLILAIVLGALFSPTALVAQSNTNHPNLSNRWLVCSLIK